MQVSGIYAKLHGVFLFFLKVLLILSDKKIAANHQDSNSVSKRQTENEPLQSQGTKPSPVLGAVLICMH